MAKSINLAPNEALWCGCDLQYSARLSATSILGGAGNRSPAELAAAGLRFQFCRPKPPCTESYKTIESDSLRAKVELRALVERIIRSPSGAAMAGLSEGLFHADPEVVLNALTEWCIRKHDEPDDYLISLAITLYNDGNNTPERLLKALEIELAGDDMPLSQLGTSARFSG